MIDTIWVSPARTSAGKATPQRATPQRATARAYTGRFFETRWSPEAVILSAAKDLSPGPAQILRCAQDDTSHLAGSFPKKPTRVRTARVPTPLHTAFTGRFFIKPPPEAHEPWTWCSSFWE